MSYGYLRSELLTAIKYRLNDPRALTDKSRWNDTQIDQAISEAIKQTEPLADLTYIDRLYPGTVYTNPDGVPLTISAVEILEVAKVESFILGRASVLPPGTWHFNRTSTNFLTMNHTPGTDELIRAHVRRKYDPEASLLSVDEAMVIEYAIATLYEQFVVYGSESTTTQDTLRAQAHRLAGDQRKLLLIQQQFPLPVPVAAGAAPTPQRASA